MTDWPIKLLYDKTKMQVGCVLLAAAYGTNRDSLYLFDTAGWFLAPTPDMKIYQVHSQEELDKIIKMTNDHWRGRN